MKSEGPLGPNVTVPMVSWLGPCPPLGLGQHAWAGRFPGDLQEAPCLEVPKPLPPGPKISPQDP